GDYDTPTFTLNGVSQTVANSGDPSILTTATFTVNSVGSYPYNIIDANGCDIDGVAEVYQVLSASGEFSSEPSCENADGEVTITADGGSGDFTYRLTGTDMFGSAVDITDANSDGIFENIAPGDYEVLVTDNQVDDGTNQCTFTVDGIVRSAPINPVIDTVDKSDISCNGETDGSASLTLVNDPDPNLNPTVQEYNLYSSDLASMPAGLDTSSRIDDNLSGTFTGLAQGTYVLEVVTDRNCFARGEITIIEPPAFTVDASAGMLMCEVGANRFSTTTLTATVTSAGNGPSYGFKIDPADSYQTTNTTSMDFVIVDDGTIQTFEVYAIDSNGCEFVSNTVTINPPSNVSGVISQERPMDCENPERIRIEVSGTTDFTIEDQGNSVAPVAPQVVSGASFVEFDLPQIAGEYRLQINDNGGCTYPLEPYTVIEPVLPTVTISQNEPVGCYNAVDGILNIEITNLASLSGFTDIYEYTVYNAADPGFSGGAFGSPVAGNSTGIIDIATDGNPATITGLPTGNLRVVIREQGKTAIACSVFSDVSFIDTPSEALDITDIDIISPVGCNNDLGEIVATTVGGWETAPYQYRLEYNDGSGFVPHTNPAYATFAANGTNNRFMGLSSGQYRIQVIDTEGCPDSMEATLTATPVIEAEALITRELQCPSGTDAVITAVEPGTTTPGAIGGVPGGGYKYRLIELDSTNLNPIDPTSHIRTTGLQDEPEFEGTSGTGVIPAGWYTIEVVSTMDCQAFTPPIEVIPPPAIRPVLIQTSVPACGNNAAMMIRVNNPQGGSYEYRRIYPDTHPMYLDPSDPSIVWEPVDETDANGLPVKTGIPGNIGEAYRFEVRNVIGSSTCLARKTNGITITDADPLSLDIASPTFDISCNGQVDGRIEAFAEGGTGIYEYRIYDYDPGSDAFAAEFLPTYDPTGSRPPVPVQDFGTFENLEEGSYWISVISRLDCGIVQGPFVIDEPVQVTITAEPTPTSCFGENDGSITMNVTSMTGGLVKFAIEPNLSEFFSDPDNPTTYTFTDLAANDGNNPSYTVLAQDAEGCPQTFELIVTEPDELTVTNVDTTPETCIDAADGTAQLTIAGGTPFVDATDPANPVEYYETRIVGPDSDGTEVFERNESLFLDNLPGGVSYIVFIRDANMCDTFVEIPIEIGVDLNAEPIVQYGCEGIFPNSTTRIALDDESRIDEILFALDPIDPSDAITSMATDVRQWGDLPAGDHTVYIYHENGCTTFVEFTIDAYEPLTLDAQKTGPNELTAIAAGGFGGYEYFFNGESYGSEGIFTTTESGVVEVRVIDQQGCIVVASIPFEFTGMLELPNFFTPNGDNENDFWSPRNREFFPDIEVIIYDRYGRVVAELDQVSEWDGLYDGNELPSGDYWYVVNQNDKRNTRYVGHFTLYR
ncbi:MAG: T9SS type B sorting domain-containing protein, partial [Pricia sp.]